MENIVGNYSTVVETLIQAMKYVHRENHSVHLGLKEDGPMGEHASKQGFGQSVLFSATSHN